MPNPIDEFLDEQKKSAAAETKTDRVHQHWHAWNEAGRPPELMGPMLTHFEPLLNQKMRLWKAPHIPEAAFKAEGMLLTMHAIEQWSPTGGAALPTYVNTHIQKLKRYNAQRQNMGSISEQLTNRIGDFQRARDDIEGETGVQATSKEIASRLGMPVRQVEQLRRSLRRDIPSSQWESDPTQQAASRMAEIQDLLPDVLSERERDVYDLLLGRNGKPKVTAPGAIAKRLGLTGSDVSRAKASIAAKIERYR